MPGLRRKPNGAHRLLCDSFSTACIHPTITLANRTATDSQPFPLVEFSAKVVCGRMRYALFQGHPYRRCNTTNILLRSAY